MQSAVNRGWLHEPYRLFHSRDKRDMDFDAHFHEFHKIVFCLNGSVMYAMEGHTFNLEPGDILIIPAHCIHRSAIRSKEEYERMILWINDDFLRSFGEIALTDIFDAASYGFFRPDPYHRNELTEILTNVEQAWGDSYQGHSLMAQTYLLQFLIRLSGYLESRTVPQKEDVRTDPRMTEILLYINDTLMDKIRVEDLAERFYISPSYLMQTFREYTGCSVHQYIIQKRLILASQQIRDGVPVLMAADNAGFGDYSSFLKAFRRAYGCSPRQIRR